VKKKIAFYYFVKNRNKEPPHKTSHSLDQLMILKKNSCSPNIQHILKPIVAESRRQVAREIVTCDTAFTEHKNMEK
jgi:hypothetical protein